jgi:hypothetical protein
LDQVTSRNLTVCSLCDKLFLLVILPHPLYFEFELIPASILVFHVRSPLSVSVPPPLHLIVDVSSFTEAALPSPPWASRPLPSPCRRTYGSLEVSSARSKTCGTIFFVKASASWTLVSTHWTSVISSSSTASRMADNSTISLFSWQLPFR